MDMEPGAFRVFTFWIAFNLWRLLCCVNTSGGIVSKGPRKTVSEINKELPLLKLDLSNKISHFHYK